MAYPTQERGKTVLDTAVNESRRIYANYFWRVKGVTDPHERLGESVRELHETLTQFDETFGFSEIPPITEDTVELSFAQLTRGLLSLLTELESGLCQYTQNREAVARTGPGYGIQAAHDEFWVQDIVDGLRCYAQSIETLTESIQKLVCPLLGRARSMT